MIYKGAIKGSIGYNPEGVLGSLGTRFGVQGFKGGGLGLRVEVFRVLGLGSGFRDLGIQGLEFKSLEVSRLGFRVAAKNRLQCSMV